MQSGAPAFGTPEYVRTAMVGGQLARRYNVPYRSRTCAPPTRSTRRPRTRACSRCGARHGRRQLHDARRRLDGGRAARQLREDGARRRPVARWSPRSSTRSSSTRPRSRSTPSSEVGPGGHFFGIAAHPGPLPQRVLQAADLRLAQLRDLAGSRQPGGAGQGQGHRQPSSSPRTSHPRWIDAVREELEAFVARRVAEGGVATDY